MIVSSNLLVTIQAIIKPLLARITRHNPTSQRGLFNCEGIMPFEVNKKCSKCKEYKPFSEFYKSKSRKDGYNGWCKKCLQPAIKRHKDTEEYRQQARDYAKRPEVRKRRNYLKRKRRKDNPEKYREVDRIERQNTDTDKLRARRTVAYAIRWKNFPKPSKFSCRTCSKQATEYHHPSYKPENWLNVIPLCKLCHAEVHSGITTSIR